MARFILFFLLIFPVCGYAQTYQFPQSYVPKNLEEALFYLYFSWPEGKREVFRKKEEEKAVAEEHFFAGLDMRNNWGLWRNSRLAGYFKAEGIYHPDDMSAIMLRSFHRDLNGTDLKIAEQLLFHKLHWEYLDQQYSEGEKRVARNYYSIQETDTVEMSFFISAEASSKAQIGLSPPAEKQTAINRENESCKLTGIVLKKEQQGKTYKLFIKLTNICQLEEVLYGNEKLQTGSIMNFDLKFHNWKKKVN
ncbi:MAG TPA: DUF6794 domain-containing protein [Adhaeribacter sp.]|nr:DUF6794 domain-containing protein [Adhaeribacter sp.]